MGQSFTAHELKLFMYLSVKRREILRGYGAPSALKTESRMRKTENKLSRMLDKKTQRKETMGGHAE